MLGVYTDDFYQGTAALTCKSHGAGKAYYIAARTATEAMVPLFRKMLQETGVEIMDLPDGVEFHERVGEEGTYRFYFNCNTTEVVVDGVSGEEMLTGEKVEGQLKLDGYGVAVVRA